MGLDLIQENRAMSKQEKSSKDGLNY